MGLRVLFGIGNPGPEYVGTRHNLGFAVVERMAAAGRAAFTPLPGLPADAARIDAGGDPLLLVRPLTYVNRCGPVLAALARITGTDRERILVVVDDLDLPPGRIRLRARGSDGGHNGLRSIEAAFESEDIPRLRIGMGGKGAQARPEYVLSTFPADEIAAVESALERAVSGVRAWAERGLETAMEVANRRDLDPGGERP
ncbi:MAG: aminoacyl-tRNA hydrolase [Planctomycetota bacterium]